MPLDELLQAKREDILQTARKYGAYNVRVKRRLHCERSV